MGLAIKSELSLSKGGIPKQDFQKALLKLNDRYRILEQKISVKTDKEIMNYYYKRENDLFLLKDTLRKSKRGSLDK